jgi:hypothetical protein
MQPLLQQTDKKAQKPKSHMCTHVSGQNQMNKENHQLSMAIYERRIRHLSILTFFDFLATITSYFDDIECRQSTTECIDLVGKRI